MEAPRDRLTLSPGDRLRLVDERAGCRVYELRVTRVCRGRVTVVAVTEGVTVHAIRAGVDAHLTPP